MILVFGTICIDRMRLAPVLPPPGGYIEITEERFLLGGEAANTANALVGWGTETLLCGNAVGMGRDGILLQELLNQKRLPLADIAKKDSQPPTPVCDIYVTPDGERTMFGVGFSTMEIGIDVEQIPYEPTAWFTAEPNMPKASVLAARLARDAGMQIYLMDFEESTGVLSPGVFWQSSTDWAGRRGNMQKNVAWVNDWVDRHGCFAILSDGPNGFVAGSPEHPVRSYPPYPAPKVVDTTGAGDLFRAGMLFGLSQNWQIAHCLQFASAAGCLKCRAVGATTDVPTVAEIVAHVEKHRSVSDQYL